MGRCPYLLNANGVCEGYVFTHVCLSTGLEGEYLGRYTPEQVHPRTKYTHPRTRYTHPPDQVHTPPLDQVHTHPRTRYTHAPGPGTPSGPDAPPDQVPPRPGTHTSPDQVNPSQQCMLGDTRNKREVRILLEFILVIFRQYFIFCFYCCSN